MPPTQSRGMIAALCLLQALTAGCVSLTPEAKQIYIVNNTQEVSACTRLGHVSVKSMACVDPASCMSAAAAQGRNQAAKMGATHLLSTFSGVNLTHGLFEGDAFKCSNDQIGVQRVELKETSPEALGCSKDTDCKGDRICEAGRCVSPANGTTSR